MSVGSSTMRALVCLTCLMANAPGTAGAAKPPEVPGVLYHGPRDQKRVALTFDACSSPHDRVDARVLDELMDLNVPATIFLGGKWAVDDAAAVERMARDPEIEIGSHGYLHPHLTRLDEAALAREVERAQAEIEKVAGRKVTLMRAPYGELDARVVKAVEQRGMRLVQFDLPSGDPDKTFTKERLVKWVVGRAKPGSIVVMHINGHGWHTAEALPEIVRAFRARGFALVRVSDLISGTTPPPAPAAHASR